MPNKLTFLTIHCTATPAGRAVTSDEIRQWHQGPVLLDGKTRYAGIVPAKGMLGYKRKVYGRIDLLPDESIGGISIRKLIGGRGWGQVGYADMFHLDGKVENLVPYNDDDNVDPWELTNGVTNGVANNANYFTRNVVYVGGMDRAYKKPQDTRTLQQRNTMELYVKKMVAKYPRIQVAGHNQFEKKACPSFSVPQWALAIGIESKNIYTGWPK